MRTQSIGHLPVPGEELLDAIPSAVVAVDPRGRIVLINRALEDLTGFSRSDLLGRPVEVLIPPEQRQSHLGHRARFARRPVRRPMGTRLAVRCLRGDGSTFPAAISLAPLPDGSVVCTIEDETDRRRTEEALLHRALHDPLTGLANRELLADRLKVALARLGRRRRDTVAVFFLDLDRFKPVNDRFGHAAGDRVLRSVAAALQGEVRPSDTVARVGGDEFVVVCEVSDGADEARRIAGRLVGAVRRATAPARDATGVTASVGVVVVADPGEPDDVVELADMAAYRAKAEGGDRFVLAGDSGRQHVMPRS